MKMIAKSSLLRGRLFPAWFLIAFSSSTLAESGEQDSASTEAVTVEAAEADATETDEQADGGANGRANDEPKSPEDKRIEKIKKEIAGLTAEKEKLEAERALADAIRQQDQAEMLATMKEQKREIEALKAQIELAQLRARSEMKDQVTELTAEGELATAKTTLAKAEAERKAAELKLLEADFRNQITELNLAIELQQKQDESRDFAHVSPQYLEEPLSDGRLVISDRRIALNGPITSRTADYITERINYFNNRDRQLPIFIVIDDSPGGSVMAGYKILKAMDGSQAPVYVVVKSFAASMAACITTLAEKSFAFPNAIILHHQIAGGLFGNLTEQEERVEELREWWSRLAGPIADKMGITKEEFIKLMYENSATGDWQEFADKATELKWVDLVVEEIEETSLLQHPDRETSAAASGSRFSAAIEDREDDPTRPVTRTDEEGRPHVLLPRLNPFDAYWLYNPDGYYRAR